MKAQVGALLRLAAVLALLVLALVDPSVPRERKLWEHLVVIDVTQSMDVIDQEIDGRPASRLQAVRHALRRALLALPCGSKLGWAVFTEHRTVLLYAPVEVCAHLDELRGTLSHIDGRLAWAGHSEVAKGLHSAVAIAAKLPGKPSLLFATDGHEAPPLDGKQRPRFDGEPGKVPGRLLGIGGDRPAPIPRSDPTGRPLGPWAAEDVIQTHPFQAGGDDPKGAPVPAPGATPGSEHLSSLRESYLRLIAGETGLGYDRIGSGPGAEPLEAVLTDPALARPVPARQPLRTPLVVLALLLLAWHLAGAPVPRRADLAGRFSGLRPARARPASATADRG